MQIGSGSVHIHVVYADDRRAGSNLLVRLMQGPSSTPVQTTYTNDAGKADFWSIPVGDYHVVVSGDGIQTTESAMFEVDARQVSQAQYVTVRPIEAGGPKPRGSRSGTVSASDLNVPSKARKELDKANEAMSRQDWSTAVELLDKAIAIYPQYAGAYNNLGVVYSRMNDAAHEQEALQKAISLDEHFAPACENLAKLYLRQKDFAQAETLLGKALSADPNNTQSLTLMADTQYMERHYDAAIATAQKAHGVVRRTSLRRALHSRQGIRTGEAKGPGAGRISDVPQGRTLRATRRSCSRRHREDAEHGAVNVGCKLLYPPQGTE